MTQRNKRHSPPFLEACTLEHKAETEHVIYLGSRMETGGEEGRESCESLPEC